MKNKNFSRGILLASAVIIQISLLILLIHFLGKFAGISLLLRLATVAAVLYISNSSIGTPYKLCWIVPLLVFPLYGGAFFFLFSKIKFMNKFKNEITPYLCDSMKKIKGQPPRTGIQRYLSDGIGYPLLTSEESEYFPTGEPLFMRMLDKMKAAKKYIYLEFFIIADGKAWDMTEKILIKKIKEGVTVKIIADYAGCLFPMSPQLRKRIISEGIEYREFNPIGLVPSGRANYRNHRKYIVCDGEYAFCCGINISDEYMNYEKRFGFWKDTGIMVSGGGAQCFSAMFEGMWSYLSGGISESFITRSLYEQKGCEVQPFSDSPLDKESVGLRVYLSLIASAHKSVCLTTPYLICDDEMLNGLKFAVKRGVRVRIITPGIPDKKAIYTVTRSYYKTLINAGVEIYEYTPGFIHSKTLVIDEKTAVVGTVNFDYRSMYMLFECGCVFYGGNVPTDVFADFERTIKISRRVSSADTEKNSLLVGIVRGFLRLFAPLM